MDIFKELEKIYKQGFLKTAFITIPLISFIILCVLYIVNQYINVFVVLIGFLVFAFVSNVLFCIIAIGVKWIWNTFKRGDD